MQEGSSPTDDLNAIGVLKRREIEARVIAPLVEELSREFGREKVLGVRRLLPLRFPLHPGQSRASGRPPHSLGARMRQGRAPFSS